MIHVLFVIFVGVLLCGCHDKHVQGLTTDQAKLLDTITHNRRRERAFIGEAAMEKFLKSWNPIGRSEDELKALFGEPNRDDGLFSYYFDTGTLVRIFRFNFKDGKVIEVVHTDG